MRVFLPSRMTIASNLAVPRYITRTKIILWTLLIVQNRFFFSYHWYIIFYNRSIILKLIIQFRFLSFHFFEEVRGKARLNISRISRRSLCRIHASFNGRSFVNYCPVSRKLFIPRSLFSSITKVFFSMDSFSFLLFCRDFSSDRLLFTHEKKKDLSRFDRCLMERFLAEWVLPLTEWILLNESRISISYLLCLNALLTSSPFSNPFFPVSTSHSFVSFFPYPNIRTFLCNNCSRKSRVQQIRIFRTFSTNGQSFVSATLVNYSRAMHRESVTGRVKLSRSRDRVVCLNGGGIPVEIVCGRAISRSPPEIPSLLTIKGASSLETTREIKKEGKKRL